MHSPTLDTPQPSKISTDACASCFYWVSGLGCCREGSPNFQTKSAIEFCTLFRADPYVPFARMKQAEMSPFSRAICLAAG